MCSAHPVVLPGLLAQGSRHKHRSGWRGEPLRGQVWTHKEPSPSLSVIEVSTDHTSAQAGRLGASCLLGMKDGRCFWQVRELVLE